MGNHLAFVTDGAAIAVPSYTRALDYELELGCVLAHGLLDATPQEAEAAIGGFVVFNDFSARDVQHAEMLSGFGPQKAKHFRNAISSIVVTADEVLPHWRALKGSVRVNGKLVSEPTSADPRWSLGEAIAHASQSERLYPGEFFGSGTLPGGSGIETGRLLAAGDVIEIGIDRIGTLTNRIVASEDAA
jgi:2-keto-4-pentenoate hydratase/2-oxohepta-3-ene-1,7-dioic acid hydratase in catechol pathway